MFQHYIVLYLKMFYSIVLYDIVLYCSILYYISLTFCEGAEPQGLAYQGFFKLGLKHHFVTFFANFVLLCLFLTLFAFICH